MKIAVPWPVKEESQPRIREALSLWEDKNLLLICLAEPCDDAFLKDFDTIVLDRNSTDIGTEVAKCYIHDMVKAVRDIYPDEDWYGFCNSDCVPVGDIIEGYGDYDTLIYHRTDIDKWENRFASSKKRVLSKELTLQVYYWREDGVKNKQIARKLNRMEAPLPEGRLEWTYPMIESIFSEDGFVFFWGQDMFLFKNHIVDNVIEKYLKEEDPILGTGGFDPRLTRWLLIKNFNGARMLNKIFHKKHESEWNIEGIEYQHNGGDIPTIEQVEYMEDTFLLSLCEQGHKGAIPKYVKYLVGRRNPELYKKMLPE